MKIVISYITEIFKIIFITFIVISISRYIMYKNKNDINYYHELTMILFISFLIGLLYEAIPIKNFNISDLGPNSINLIPFKFITILNNNDISYLIINVIGNVILFIVIGFFIPLLWNIKDVNVIIGGIFISIFIEVIQLFINRNTDIDDLILNTLGTVIGLFVYKKLYNLFKIYFDKFK